jgi:hypothetical protein
VRLTETALAWAGIPDARPRRRSSASGLNLLDWALDSADEGLSAARLQRLGLAYAAEQRGARITTAV